MRRVTALFTLATAALVLTPLAVFAGGHGQGRGGEAGPPERAQVERGQQDHDRDRMRDRDRIEEPEHDRDRIQDRTHAPDTAGFNDNDIYGHELMSVQERNEYREQLRLVEGDPEKKTQFMAQHREEMQVRAKAQGVNVDNGDEAEESE